jgi:hypothetical protein
MTNTSNNQINLIEKNVKNKEKYKQFLFTKFLDTFKNNDNKIINNKNQNQE